jgi:DNA polymerase-3 subunit alpha
MVALLNSSIGNTEKVATAVAECRRLQIQVHRPDINRSEAEFSIEELDGGALSIRFGMTAVKNVGASAVRPMIEARGDGGPFTSVEQMCRVADMGALNRKALESLIKAGAFDTFGDRGALVDAAERILALAQSEARLKDSGQTTMFDLFGETVATPLANLAIPEADTPESEQRGWEVELLGMALSGNNLLNRLAADGDSETVVFRGQLESGMAGKKVVLAGQVSMVTERLTREQKPFSIVALDLLDGEVEVFVWEELLRATSGLWEPGKLVMVVGVVRVREDQISISCTDASEYVVPEEGGKASLRDDSTVPVSEIVTQSGHESDPAQVNGTTSLRPETNGVAASGPRVAPSAGSESRLVRQLRVRIQETERPSDDQALLEDVSRLLLEYGGEDEVSLEIATDGRIITMEWPVVRVNACSELEERLQDLVGTSGRVSVQGGQP